MWKSLHIFAAFFESKTMTNREKILKIMEAEHMSARQFSEAVGIQNGTLSNILNGRNDASNEVIKKILMRFHHISAEWFMRDQGPMYVTADGTQQALFDIKPLELEVKEDEQPKVSEDSKNRIVAKKEQPVQVAPKSIERIVVFFSDGTFQELKS